MFFVSVDSGTKAAYLKATTILKKYHAKLSVEVIIFKEEGNVTFGNESYGIQKGSIKLFIKVRIQPTVSVCTCKQLPFLKHLIKKSLSKDNTAATNKDVKRCHLI